MTVAPLKRLLHLPIWAFAPLYVAAHLLLDWATYIPAFSPLGITAWNPTTGLAFGLMLLKGPAYAALFGFAALVSDIFVRRIPFPTSIALTEVVLVSLSYAAGLVYLRLARPVFDLRLARVRDLMRLAGTAALSAAVVAVIYVGVLVFAGLLPAVQLAASAFRYWIGETIGILVITPFVLTQLTSVRGLAPSLEVGAQALAILVAIVLVLWLGTSYQTQLFYVLFLPIVWVAVRHGFPAVAAALVLMQVGIMITLHLGSHDAVDVTEFQAVLLVMVLAGLTIGILISERQGDETRLRLQQDAIARASRIASVDRATTAIAHEINQPLTAIANYSRASMRALAVDAPDLALAREMSSKAFAEVERVAEIIRRLRGLISAGRTEPTPQRPADIIREALELIRPDIERQGVAVELDVPRTLPAVMADLVQIEQVLINVVRNAIEAMSDLEPPDRRIRIAAEAATEGVRVHVSDRGPGFPPGFRLVSDLPSPTSKPGGLGIGLTLCLAIVEAHGGTLTISPPGHPGTVTFTLRFAHGDRHGTAR